MIAYALVWLLSRLFRALPLRVALAAGRGLGALVFHLVRFRRGVVLANLEHVLGAATTPAERRAIALDTYRQFGMVFVEILRSAVTGEPGLIQNVEIAHIERFRALRDARTPLIFLQPHAGNFDLAAYSFGARGFPHHAVMRKIKNRRIHDMIVATRERHGVHVLVKGPETMDDLREALARGEWLGLVPDQNAKARGVTVDWLGKPASIFRGPALLHLESGAQIIAVVDVRRADDPRRHAPRFIFLPPYAATADREADTRAVMQQVADAMGAEILKNPSQYFWFHRLWGREVAAGASDPLRAEVGSTGA